MRNFADCQILKMAAKACKCKNREIFDKKANTSVSTIKNTKRYRCNVRVYLVILVVQAKCLAHAKVADLRMLFTGQQDITGGKIPMNEFH